MKLTVRQPIARVGLTATAFVLAAALAGCGSSSSGGSGSSSSSGATPTTSHPVTLRIAYNPNPTNTTIVVADQQGFFKKNGLDVKLTSTQASSALLPSLGKQFDLITVTPPTVLQASAQGLNPVLVSAQTVEDNAKLTNTFMVAAKSIGSVADLKGKTIGVPSLSGNLYEGAVIALHKAGLSKTDVKFLQVPFANMDAGIKNGTIQAAVTIFPFQGQMLGEGDKVLGNPVTEAGGDPALSAGWVASASWAKANGPTVAAFDKAQDEALAWMNKNVAASRAILVKNFQLPAFVAKTFPVTQFFSFEAKAAYLQPWIAPMKAVGDLPKSFNTSAESLIYTK